MVKYVIRSEDCGLFGKLAFGILGAVLGLLGAALGLLGALFAVIATICSVPLVFGAGLIVDLFGKETEETEETED